MTPSLSTSRRAEPAPALLPAAEIAAALTLRGAANGLRFATLGETGIAPAELERVVQAVPSALACSLRGHAFYFVPLALPGTRRAEDAQTVISNGYSPALADEAICHRAVSLPAAGETPAHEAIFLSARLMRDTFGLAFELFINVAHAFAAAAGPAFPPQTFADLVWTQAGAQVKGETSQDAWESRADALAPDADPKFKAEYMETAFADALAIYQLSLAVDFDYAELREREYPLLAPAALAERLRLMAGLYPPNPGYEFSIRYRRR